jgi:transcription-repair coupling factor (superfamily II helicase)
VAALDLEIRGAGNLLGGEQSGHIDAVGFEMYMKLLEETIRELKGEDIEDDVRATVNLRVDVKIEESYIPDMNQRLMIYRKVAAARSESDLDATLAETRDRYGALPPSVLNLAEYGRVRVIADRLGVDSIDREGRLVVIKFRPQARVDPVRLVKVVSEWPGATLVPPVSLKLDLEAAPAEARPAPRRPEPTSPAGDRGRLRGGKPGARKDEPSSWWTARARAGEVTAGFTREEILRRPEADPRAPGGMFSRLEELLRTLGS